MLRSLLGHPSRGLLRQVGTVAEERRLQVEFNNGKDLPITVSEMRVEFYKGSQPLEDWACPGLEFVAHFDGVGDRRADLAPPW